MRRFVSILLATTMMVVSVVPVLQAKPGCASVPQIQESSCHSSMDMDHHDMHDEHAMLTPQHQNLPVMSMKHDKHELSAAERECRIECGCGCNRTVDGFPHVLAPHIMAQQAYIAHETSIMVKPADMLVLTMIDLSDPSPPPKFI